MHLIVFIYNKILCIIIISSGLLDETIIYFNLQYFIVGIDIKIKNGIPI